MNVNNINIGRLPKNFIIEVNKNNNTNIVINVVINLDDETFAFNSSIFIILINYIFLFKNIFTI